MSTPTGSTPVDDRAGATAVTPLPRPTPRLVRVRRRQGWLLALAVLLVALVAWRASQVPVFGAFEVRAITAGTMSLALLAMAQAVVVLTGGINLSVGALMVLVNCIAARFMDGRGPAACLGVAALAVLVAVALSAATGWIINASGIPDIVVTLALSFCLGGAALLVLHEPGGGTSLDFQNLLVGDFGTPLPSILWIVVILAAIWVPFRRSRAGAAVYALGSDRRAAYLSGVDVARTRITAYAMSGVFVGLAGVVTTAFTGSGEPRASIGLTALLNSVAAVVLGGVALTGGVGGLVGPVLASYTLTLIPAIMLGLGWDPNLAEVARGGIIIVVVLVGTVIQTRRTS